MRRTTLILLTLALTAAVVACSGSDVEPAATATPRAASAPTTAGMDEGGPTMELTSSAFEHNEAIPEQYSCDGDDISPPLTITDIPERTDNFVLIVDDPDAPGGTWDHWIEFNIPASTIMVPEDVGLLGTPGNNSWGRTGYGGPCPPGGTHRYLFKLYALDAALRLEAGSTKQQVEAAMAGHILATAELIGLYSR